MTLDSILRKYVAENESHIKLDDKFKLYIDADGDIVYTPEGGKYPEYIYTSEGGGLHELIEFILNEAGIQ